MKGGGQGSEAYWGGGVPLSAERCGTPSERPTNSGAAPGGADLINYGDARRTKSSRASDLCGILQGATSVACRITGTGSEGWTTSTSRS